MNFYVIYVNERNVPGELLGPFSYQEAEFCLIDKVKKNGVTDGVTASDLLEAEKDGSWAYSDGSGHYIIQSESGE